MKISKEQNLHKIQKIQLDILSHFSELCEKNNLQYFLNYGTLLGAVRHSGFIPWDDDIDIMMPRNDYDRLIDVLKENEHEYYKFISMHSDRKYFAPIAKMYDNRTRLIQDYGQRESHEIGIYIDIFILDGLPNDTIEQKKIVKKANRLRFLWSLSIRKLNAKSRNLLIAIVKTIISIPFILVGYRYFLKKLDTYCSRYDVDSSEYVAVLCFGEGERDVFKKSDIMPPRMIRFENRDYPCPNNTEVYLKNMYGDYMSIPPEEERKVHKNTVYFDMETFKQ